MHPKPVIGLDIFCIQNSVKKLSVQNTFKCQIICVLVADVVTWTTNKREGQMTEVDRSVPSWITHKKGIGQPLCLEFWNSSQQNLLSSCPPGYKHSLSLSL